MTANTLRIAGAGRSLLGTGRAAPALALQPTGITVASGDFVAILRHSDQGKAMPLPGVAGLDDPSTRCVLLHDTPVAGPATDRAMVFRSRTPCPWSTVERTSCFGLDAPGFRRRRTGRSRHVPSTASVCAESRTTGPGSCRAPCASTSRWRARWPTTRRIPLLGGPFGAFDHRKRKLMQHPLPEVSDTDRKTAPFIVHDIDAAIVLACRALVMSARPGRNKAEVAVPLPYLRHGMVQTTPGPGALRARLMGEIREEVGRAAAG